MSVVATLIAILAILAAVIVNPVHFRQCLIVALSVTLRQLVALLTSIDDALVESLETVQSEATEPAIETADRPACLRPPSASEKSTIALTPPTKESHEGDVMARPIEHFTRTSSTRDRSFRRSNASVSDLTVISVDQHPVKDKDMLSLTETSSCDEEETIHPAPPRRNSRTSRSSQRSWSGQSRGLRRSNASVGDMHEPELEPACMSSLVEAIAPSFTSSCDIPHTARDRHSVAMTRAPTIDQALASVQPNSTTSTATELSPLADTYHLLCQSGHRDSLYGYSDKSSYDGFSRGAFSLRTSSTAEPKAENYPVMQDRHSVAKPAGLSGASVKQSNGVQVQQAAESNDTKDVLSYIIRAFKKKKHASHMQPNSKQVTAFMLEVEQRISCAP